ncbi:hypothetical protein CN187_07830 [Sinorhizobium meliloti]|uniref:hypothetical protein n=1 Tax=Rhizobium meliloti TaxID=382 RepID=UPI000FD8C484|nr:hypothetical protein [Sinorhizobium meliloti]MDE3797698.1 hypothetical protein [Sinorhizobium meliloti]RVI69951.1 hypothetical protein CN187_07830 [Sinorhizobium meliloti]
MNQQQPNDSEPAAFAAVVACAIIAAVVLIFTSLSDGDVRSPETWVYRYQTLIAGVLAVAAALATVWQMRASDAEQERRHRQTQRDTRRSDVFAAKRLKAFLPTAARENARYIRAYFDADERKPAKHGMRLFARTVTEEFQQALLDVRVTACFHLLPHDVFEALENCKRLAGLTLGSGEQAAKIAADNPKEAEDLQRQLEESFMETLEREAHRLAELLDQWTLEFVAD